MASDQGDVDHDTTTRSQKDCDPPDSKRGEKGNFMNQQNPSASLGIANTESYKERRKRRNPERKRHGARNQHRSKFFCKWILEKFPSIEIESSTDPHPNEQNTCDDHSPTSIAQHVLDVAGGKGELAARLSMCHRLRVVMVDPREADLLNCFESLVLPKLPNKHQSRYQERISEDPNFGKNVVEERFRQIVSNFDDYTLRDKSGELRQVVSNASLLIGLHADGATEAIVDAALEFSKPFVVVPCCVFPSLFSQRLVLEEGKMVQVRSHEQFCRYLVQKDPRFIMETLPFEGRNVAIWWDGKEKAQSKNDRTSTLDNKS